MATRTLESPTVSAPAVDPAPLATAPAPLAAAVPAPAPPTDPASPPASDRDARQWTCAHCGAGAAIGEYFVDAGVSEAILESLRRQHLAVCEAPQITSGSTAG